MRSLSPNALGSLYMAIGSLGYVINDGFVRRITDEGPGVYQVLCMRSIGLVVLFAAISRARGETVSRTHLQRPVQIRVAAEVTSAALFFAAIVHLDFAVAQAILQIVPFAVTLAAAVVLREHVTRWQYVTILVGFVGVLLIVRPGSDAFSGWSLMVIASAFVLVVRELATRDVAADVPTGSVAFFTAAGLALLTAALSLPGGWHPLNGTAVIYLVLSAAALMVGYVFTIQTVRVGDLSVSAPFRYSVLVGAVIVGYILFDEVPDGLTIAGSIVIIASGVVAIQLEARRRQPSGDAGGTNGPSTA